MARPPTHAMWCTHQIPPEHQCALVRRRRHPVHLSRPYVGRPAQSAGGATGARTCGSACGEMAAAEHSRDAGGHDDKDAGGHDRCQPVACNNTHSWRINRGIRIQFFCDATAAKGAGGGGLPGGPSPRLFSCWWQPAVILSAAPRQLGSVRDRQAGAVVDLGVLGACLPRTRGRRSDPAGSRGTRSPAMFIL
jgi:hypothetical protein